MDKSTRSSDAWAAAAAAVPQRGRGESEGTFWSTLTTVWGWRLVVDAGCGAGFHVRTLRELGVSCFGFDVALPALVGAPSGAVAVADVLALPLRSASADAALCLGNTFSLLDSREAQKRALEALAASVRPGGVVLLQGEDVGLTVRDGVAARLRNLDQGGVHVRVFRREGPVVEMLAGVVAAGGQATLRSTRMLPTTAHDLRSLGVAAGIDLPVAAPATSTSTWWLALRV